MTCNTALPWKHLHRPIAFRACQKLELAAGSSTRAHSSLARDQDQHGGGVRGSHLHGRRRVVAHEERSLGTDARARTQNQALHASTKRQDDLRTASNAGHRGIRMFSSSGPHRHPLPERPTSTSAAQETLEVLSDKPGTRPRLRRMFTILTDNPHKHSLSELVRSIPDFELCKGPDHPLLVFLITLAYAAEAVQKPELFESIIKRSSRHAAPKNPQRGRANPEHREKFSGTYDVLVAVVDRLPRRERTNDNTNPSDFDGTGSEGIAFVSTRADGQLSASESELGQVKTEDRRAAVHSSKQPGSLNFRINTHKPLSKPVNGSRDLPPDSYIESLLIQMPLANTVFLNSMPSTLIYTRYWQEESSEARYPVWTRNMESCSVTLPYSMPVLDWQNTGIRVPLQALTPTRVVDASMGNIIRTFTGTSKPDQPETDPVPASTELEEAVSNYFSSNAITPQAATVWALVVPQKTRMAFFLSNENQDLSKFHVRTLMTWLRHRAKLCRVMSGGGGWGKKAGLLSLDPDTEYKTGAEQADTFPAMLLDDGDGSLPLEEIASRGDLVKFFIAPYSLAEPPAQIDKIAFRRQECLGSGADVRFNFGVIPSSIDTMVKIRTTGLGEQSSPVRVYEEHFGALSEGGMAVTITPDSLKGPPKDPQSNPGRSKIDVPFSRITLTRRLDESSGPRSKIQASGNPVKDVETMPKVTGNDHSGKVSSRVSGAGEASRTKRRRGSPHVQEPNIESSSLPTYQRPPVHAQGFRIRYGSRLYPRARGTRSTPKDGHPTGHDQSADATKATTDTPAHEDVTDLGPRFKTLPSVSTSGVQTTQISPADTVTVMAGSENHGDASNTGPEAVQDFEPHDVQVRKVEAGKVSTGTLLTAVTKMTQVIGAQSRDRISHGTHQRRSYHTKLNSRAPVADETPRNHESFAGAAVSDDASSPPLIRKFMSKSTFEPVLTIRKIAVYPVPRIRRLHAKPYEVATVPRIHRAAFETRPSKMMSGPQTSTHSSRHDETGLTSAAYQHEQTPSRAYGTSSTTDESPPVIRFRRVVPDGRPPNRNRLLTARRRRNSTPRNLRILLLRVRRVFRSRPVRDSATSEATSSASRKRPARNTRRTDARLFIRRLRSNPRFLLRFIKGTPYRSMQSISQRLRDRWMERVARRTSLFEHVKARAAAGRRGRGGGSGSIPQKSMRETDHGLEADVVDLIAGKRR